MATKRKIVNFFGRIIEKIFAIFGKELDENKKRTYLQFIGFCFVGVTSFIVNYLVYAFCFKTLGFNVYVSAVFSFIISVLNAYIWNNQFVFSKEKEHHWIRNLLRTYISYGFTGLLLTEALLYVEVDVLGIHPLLAPVINLVITTPINFLLNKYWAFKEKREVDDE